MSISKIYPKQESIFKKKNHLNKSPRITNYLKKGPKWLFRIKFHLNKSPIFGKISPKREVSKRSGAGNNTTPKWSVAPSPLPEVAFRKCRKNHRGIILFSHKNIPTHGWWENNHRWAILIYRNMNLIMDDEPRSKLNEKHWQLIGLIMILICKVHIPKKNTHTKKRGLFNDESAFY